MNNILLMHEESIKHTEFTIAWLKSVQIRENIPDSAQISVDTEYAVECDVTFQWDAQQ